MAVAEDRSASRRATVYTRQTRDDGDYERPEASERVRAVDALRRHWRLALAPAIVLMLAGIAVGVVRHPVYTATDRMTIQIQTSEAGALNNTAEAAIAQASTYSRAINATGVVLPVAQQLHRSITDVASNLSATPVGQSPDFRVAATGPSSGQAVQLANLATDSLSSYIATVTQAGNPASALKQYQQAARAYSVQLARQNQVQAAVGPNPSRAGQVLLDQAQSATQAAQLQRDTLKARYQAAQLAPTTSVLVLDRATAATSDRASKAELLGFLGLIAGLALGAVLALMRAASLGGGRQEELSRGMTLRG